VQIKAVLFDLDNTLILFDEKKFYDEYSKKLYMSFRDILSPQEFGRRLMSSTQVMTNNNGRQSNAEFFINDFSKNLPVKKEDLWQRFERFYNSEFETLEYLMQPLKNSKDILEKISTAGIKIVIASNPMFPANVQLLRLRWAGLEGVPFDLITDANNSTFCKPNLKYYLEICSKIDVLPEYCLMTGNDRFNDMIASKTGMKTFLTTDSIDTSIDISREIVDNLEIEMPEPDYIGKLDEMLEFIAID